MRLRIPLPFFFCLLFFLKHKYSLQACISAFVGPKMNYGWFVFELIVFLIEWKRIQFSNFLFLLHQQRRTLPHTQLQDPKTQLVEALIIKLFPFYNLCFLRRLTGISEVNNLHSASFRGNSVFFCIFRGNLSF